MKSATNFRGFPPNLWGPKEIFPHQPPWWDEGWPRRMWRDAIRSEEQLWAAVEDRSTDPADPAETREPRWKMWWVFTLRKKTYQKKEVVYASKDGAWISFERDFMFGGSLDPGNGRSADCCFTFSRVNRTWDPSSWSWGSGKPYEYYSCTILYSP